MARVDQLILDAWAQLAHWPIFRNTLADGTGAGSLAPTWVGKNGRRLNAYLIYKAYKANNSRALFTTTTETVRDQHREYGDPALICAQVRAALLADMRITVDGAEGEPPPEPIAPPPGAGPEEKAEFQTRLDAWKQSLDDRTPALDVQDWFDGWAADERFKRKVVQNEDLAVCLGDGVMAAVWSASAGRPVIRVFAPDSFFPVVVPFQVDDAFPDRVHIAWSECAPDALVPRAPDIEYVHRITYELIDLAAPGVDLSGREGLLAPLPWEQAGPEDTGGEGVRRSLKRCFMSEGVWRLTDLGGVLDPDDFPRSKARWLPDPDDPLGIAVLDHKPLGIDFLPLVHVPNTIPEPGEMWGTSILANVTQLLDDIADSDSDEQQSSRLTGTPPIWLKDAAGVDGILSSYGPGTVWKLSAEGQAGMIDVSTSLDAMAGHAGRLRDTLSVNARVPAEILGRVNASDVPSGVAMALAFGPFQSLIDDMRLIRSEKYALLLKFVARLAQLAGPANGGLPVGPLPEVELTFGSYLPSDLTGIVTLLLTALEGHGLSRATFLRLAAQAGLELGDLVDEEARIRSEDFAGAQTLADAVGSDTAAAEYLGVELPEKPAVSAAGVAAAAAVGGPGPVGPPPTAGVPVPPNQPGTARGQ